MEEGRGKRERGERDGGHFNSVYAHSTIPSQTVADLRAMSLVSPHPKQWPN